MPIKIQTHRNSIKDSKNKEPKLKTPKLLVASLNIHLGSRKVSEKN